MILREERARRDGLSSTENETQDWRTPSSTRWRYFGFCLHFVSFFTDQDVPLDPPSIRTRLPMTKLSTENYFF